MENVHNPCKNLLESAIFAGIITEEDKQFYLSTLADESDSDVTEIESLLNTEGKHSSFTFAQECGNTDPLHKTDNKFHKEVEKQVQNIEECYPIPSEDTIENYSALDIRKSKYEDFTFDSESKNSFITERDANSRSIQNLDSSKVPPKAAKTEKQKQILDFDVPVYLSIKKKKENIKHPLNATNVLQYEKLNRNMYEARSSNLEWDKESKSNKCIYSRLTKKKQIVSFKNSKASGDCNAANLNNKSEIEESASEISAEYSPVARKSVYTLPPRNGSLEHIENPDFISKYLDAESNKKACQSTNQKHTTGSLRRPENRLTDQEPKFDVRLDDDTNSCKNILKDLLQAAKENGKCKHCKCSCEQQVPSSTYTAETGEESDSTYNVPIKSCGRGLNVNIICKFYRDEDEQKRENNQNLQPSKSSLSQIAAGDRKQEYDQDSQSKTDEPDPVSENPKDPEKRVSENEKAKRLSKIQRLSRIFTFAKTKKKKPESHA